jgi:hypothetical protein
VAHPLKYQCPKILLHSFNLIFERILSIFIKRTCVVVCSGGVVYGGVVYGGVVYGGVVCSGV